MGNPSLLILPGDGIGAEVMEQVQRIIDWYGDNRGLKFDTEAEAIEIANAIGDFAKQ